MTWQLLVVDDSAGDVLITTRALTRSASPDQPVQITDAQTLAQARDAMAKAAFDCVLLDLGLPDARGTVSIDRIRGLAPQTPIIVLSGSESPQARQEAMASGASAYLVKKPLSQSHDIYRAVADVMNTR